VYNTESQNWEGYCTFPSGVQIDRLFETDYCGAKRLYMADFANGRTHVLFEGRQDTIGNSRYEIPTTLWTRGYLLAEAPPYATVLNAAIHNKDFREVRVAMATWNPKVTVTAIPNGVGTDEVLLPNPWTRDRAKWNTLRSPITLSNRYRNFEDDGRQDYSVTLTTPVELGDGIVLDHEQEYEEAFVTRTRGRYLSIRIDSTQGSCSVHNVTVYGRPAQRTSKSASA
jgi:hypothetical protein